MQALAFKERDTPHSDFSARVTHLFLCQPKLYGSLNLTSTMSKVLNPRKKEHIVSFQGQIKHNLDISLVLNMIGCLIYRCVYM